MLLDVLLWIVLLPGCVAWLAALFVARKALAVVPDLARQPLAPRERWPSLSVVVPARNEEVTLPDAARSLLAADYPDLEVIVVDDRSTDGTGAVVDELARDPRVTAVHVTELPDGWLGKNHALHVGAQRARGEWLLFTDADVHFTPDALSRAVAHAEQERLDFLALLPEVWAGGFLLDASIAAFGRGLVLGQRIWAVSDPDSDAALGVGAFNLVRRQALERSAGLPWLALDVVDDLALGKLMKTSGARCAVASGIGLVGLRWYTSLPEMVRGLDKNTFAVMGFSVWRAGAACAVTALLDLSPWIALLPLGVPGLRVAGAIGLAAQLLLAGTLAVWARRPLLPALAVPAGTALMVFIMARAALLGRRRGGIHWRDTFYSSERLREGARVTWP